MKRVTSLLACACAAACAHAFLPAVDRLDGVTASIPGFEDGVHTNKTHGWRTLATRMVNASAPLSFNVVLSNAGATARSGSIKVYLNDDWSVEGRQGALRLAAGEVASLPYTAKAGPRTVNALYPIHAEVSLEGAARALHPIAVFGTTNAPAGVAPKRVAKPKTQAAPQDDTFWLAREKTAVAAARRAFAEGAAPAEGRYVIEDEGCRFGAGVVTGACGLVDGVIAFTDGARELVFRGFDCEIDDRPAAECAGRVPFRADVDVTGGALRVKWSMPGVVRSPDGHPRFTRLALGGCSQAVRRGYLGFGNVIENPHTFTCSAGGFTHNTRHVGADYDNGLSLVHATETIQQKPFVSDEKTHTWSTVTGNDATFFLVPGAKGAFDAARRFRKVSGYKAGPGRASIETRVCLDKWFDENYTNITRQVGELVKYGVTNCVYVKHDWRRWGWDYTVPDDDPPKCGKGTFAECVRAIQAAGMLYCPHDNYIDFYPYCPNYTYDEIVFNLDGTPQKAFYNPGRNILSYRWLPQAMIPCARRNMRMMRESFAPEGLFLDVYTAHCPTDYLDRDGRYHSREEMSEWWGRTFRACMDELGKPTGPAISEAGQDHLIGVIDGGQSDHFDARRFIRGEGKFDDAELVPWHDMVSHGFFTLFGGGLEYRYSAREEFDKKVDIARHGYGTDDYLCTTLIGGRNPMALGSFCARTVHTYWMLHDLCASLARAELSGFAFGPDIHRQHSTFSNGAEVWVNRSTNATWKVGDVTLPTYGFLAKAPDGLSCGSILRDGLAVAFSKGPGKLYVDARAGDKAVALEGVRTTGSFRLEHPEGGNVWRMIPLPGGKGAFAAELDLARLGGTGKVVKRIAEETTGTELSGWKQNGGALSFVARKDVFAYRIELADGTGQEIGNGRLKVRLSTVDGSLVVADAESGRAWRSGAEFANAPVEVSDVVKTSPTSMVYRVKPRDWREFTCCASVDGGELDVAIEAPAEAKMTGYRLGYPFPFASEAGDRFYFPNGCGLSFPCEAKDPSGIGDASINRALEKSQRGYQTSMKMGCWIQYAEKPAADGSLEQGAGMLAIVGTPWNIYLNFSMGDNGRRTVGLDWSPDMAKFGHARRIRYCFFTKATPGNLARRYRAEMERRGFRVTLKEKAAKYPAIAKNLDLLKGAPNIWYWSERPDKVEKALELKELGFGNILFSTVTRHDLGVWITPEEKRRLAKIPGVLCTEYDIYRDTMEPEMVDKIDYLRPHWPLGVWDAGDYVVDGDGKPRRGWKVPLKSDPSKPCIGCLGLCERQAPPYIRVRVAKLQAEAAIGARFFDVTGTGIGECWHPRHRVSRRESMKARQDMFRIAHEEFGLVAGTEDGLECYVPDVDYFEGVFNASYWRVDGGRYMWKIYEETPPVIQRSLDPTMRFPFWEMVFRDCVVGYWYWTCYNNKFPQDWWKMDLLNVVAGTPPMYLFTPEVFERQRDRLAASVRRAASTARATKDALLEEFRWLTADRLVQESVFSNGYRVIANFSDKPYVAPDGTVVPPRDYISSSQRTGRPLSQ